MVISNLLMKHCNQTIINKNSKVNLHEKNSRMKTSSANVMSLRTNGNADYSQEKIRGGALTECSHPINVLKILNSFNKQV
ncbi:CLUMA_CG008633, isoform A [Clunio marinus]|uniref:CLUMA_CG008633, isoform A n=1 Tax=Clunio marinus TaxID=568069 RepID=A0A1J1I6F4_9DIPT|nr:CLUMA_CG008633, isoform A [Clunio marinus]